MEDTPDFEDFQWDDVNAAHVKRRGLNPAILHAVATGTPRSMPNKEGRQGSHVVIGPDRRGRFWTIIMKRVSNGRWRPITGWPSKAREIALYRELSGE